LFKQQGRTLKQFAIGANEIKQIASEIADARFAINRLFYSLARRTLGSSRSHCTVLGVAEDQPNNAERHGDVICATRTQEETPHRRGGRVRVAILCLDTNI